jgi:hypothetical protein
VNVGRVLPLVVLTAVVFIGTGALAPVPFLLLDVADGRQVHLALPDGEFIYRYRHSVYDVLVEERFQVTPNGLRQIEIQSADRRALEYYGLPYEPRARGALLVMPGSPDAMREIPLLVLRDQEQAIAIGARRFDLSREIGDARLSLRPVQRARVSVVLPGTR